MEVILSFISFIEGKRLGVDVAILALVGGLAAFVIFYGLTVPLKGRPRGGKVSLQSGKIGSGIGSIQKQLNSAGIDIPASLFVRKSLTLGLPLGFAMWLLMGSIVMVCMGVLTGFMVTWTKYEQERDLKNVKYAKQLASVCDTIRTSYGVNPSMKKALEAVAEYSPMPAKGDFQEVLLAASQERLVEGLQAVAERRKSIVFDAVSTALIRANDSTGEVGDMLTRLADSTRQNVGAFEDAVASQINARSNIIWGSFGPWVVFCAFRLAVLVISLSAEDGFNPFAKSVSFFGTFQGNMIALMASAITIYVYRKAMNTAQRGLIVQRVSALEDLKKDEPMVQGGQTGNSASATSLQRKKRLFDFAR